MGGHYMFDDDQETPNTMVVTYDFEEGGKKKLLVFEVRHWISNRESDVCARRKDPNTVGNIFYGSNGYMTFEWYNKYASYLGKEQQPGPTRDEAGDNWANFIGAVRGRKHSDLNAPIEEGAVSCALMHLGNLSYRLGRTLTFDSKTMTCVGDEEANRMFTRSYRAPFAVPERV